MKPIIRIILILTCVGFAQNYTVYGQVAVPCPNGHKFRDAECLANCGMGPARDSSGGATSRQQQGQAIADHLMNSFNRAQEQNRAWEDMQEARRERERREAAEERAYYARQQEAERVRQFEAAPAKVPAPASAQAAAPPAIPVPIPAPEPYTPPSLGGYLGDDAKKFGAEVLVETADILVGQFNNGAANLRDAAKGGIRDLPGRTYDAIADDLLDSGKDAAKDAAMNLLSEDKQIFIRAVDIPLSILTRNWDAIQEAWSGQNSLWEKHVSNPLDSFTVQTSADRQNERIAYLRKRIRDCEENIRYYTRRITRFKEGLGTPGLHRLEYEYRENEIRSDTRYLQDAKRRKAEYEALLRNLSP